MSALQLESAAKTAQPQQDQPLEQKDQHSRERTTGTGCSCEYPHGQKKKKEAHSSDSAVVEIHLVGSVSSTGFQRLKQVVRWIRQTYSTQVSVHIQDELEETARTCIAERKAAIGGDLLQHPRDDWLIYGLLPNDTFMYFKDVEDFLHWAASEFLFEDNLLKEEPPVEALARRAVSERISELCKGSTKVFCRVVFRVQPLQTAARLAAPNDEKEAPTAGSVLLAGSDSLSTSPGVEVYFEIESALVPCCSGAFLAAARKKKYDGCVVHRVVPRGWIQFGDLVDGSGAHSGDWEPVPEEEKFALLHDRAGILGMCKSQKGGSSQFYITLRPYSRFDGFLVAIGKAVSGLQELVRVVHEEVQCDVNQRPLEDCFTVDTIEVITA